MATAKRKRAKRIKGVCAIATALGVSRGHLARGLRGERPISKALLERYRAEKTAQETKGTTAP